MDQLPAQMPYFPPFRRSVAEAISDDRLLAAAADTDDPEVLLGLAFLANAGSPVRTKICRTAGQACDYRPVCAVIAVILDRIDEATVDHLIETDTDNALGYYLRGALLHVSNQQNHALEAFRKVAACQDLRLYESVTGSALFKALDKLELRGGDRVCALSWTATRSSNFSSLTMQSVNWALSELAHKAAPSLRAEIAEMLLTFAGHLYATNFQNRWFAERALERAFALKAELSAATAPAAMFGYVAAVHSLNSQHFRWPGVDDDLRPNPSEVARFLPDRIHRACVASDPSLLDARILGETNLNPPASDRPAFETAKQKLTQAARALLEVITSDPDRILGPYLKGLPPLRRQGEGAIWQAFCTPVGTLIQEKPDVLRAAIAYEAAMTALWKAGQNDPSRRNILQMMQIGWAIAAYALNHNDHYPETIQDVQGGGLLDRSVAPNSLLTGKPYVYVAAGKSRPLKMNDMGQFVLLYDDELHAGEYYNCVFASGVGGGVSRQDLFQQIG